MQTIGPFQIIEEIGVGGMGKVYKAHHPTLEKTVAIKVLLNNNTSLESKKRFFNESQLMAKLRHPNIIAVYDMKTDEKTKVDYIVMDFISGTTLAKIVKKFTSQKHTLKFIKQIALAIEYAHFWLLSKQQQKANNLLKKAQNLVPKKLMLMDLQKGKLHQKNIENTILALDFLEKAQQLKPQDKKIKAKLHYLQKNIGWFALQKKDYLLSRIAFSRCARWANINRKKLLDIVEQSKNQLKQKRLQKLKKIMAHVNKDSIEWDVVKILRIKSHEVTKRLLFFLKNGTFIQCTLAIKALGKLKDRHTTWNQKDSVQWLIEKLQKLNGKKDFDRAENIVWALGWLSDSRAEDIVSKTRNFFGDHSNFWTRTQTPYRWIPLPKQTSFTYREYLKRGIKKHAKWFLKSAFADFSKCLELKPDYAKAYYWRAKTNARLQNIKKALKDCLQAIKINRKYAEAYVEYAVLLKEIRRYKQSIKTFNYAIKLKPDLPHVYTWRGFAYQRKKEYQKAIADYTKSIERNPVSGAYRNRAVCYDKLKQWKKALADYRQALKLEPKNAFIYSNRSTLYMRLGKIEKATEDLNKAINYNPQSKFTYLNRGNIFLAKELWERAIRDYSLAINLGLKTSSPYRNRATAFFCMRKFKDAYQDYQKCIKLNPNYIYHYIWIFICGAHIGKDEKKLLLEYLNKTKNNSWLLAVIKLYLNKISISEFLHIAKLKNSTKEKKCEIFFYLGQHYVLQKKRGQALLYFQKCQKLQLISFTEYHIALAELKYLQKSY